MGIAYNLEFNLEKALEWHTKSLEINLRCIGEFHRNVAATYNNIGLIHSRRNEFDLALENYEKALKI
jgi:tetratricopeptide (TPR) repeat protein